MPLDSGASRKRLQRPAYKESLHKLESILSHGRNRPQPRQLALISQKGQSSIRDREAYNREGKTQEAEEASNLSSIFSPMNLRMHVQSAVGPAHQESDSAATIGHDIADSQPSQIPVCEESATMPLLKA